MGKKTAKVKVTAKSKSKAVKPTFSSGNNGGVLTGTIVATVNKNKSKK